MIKGLSYDVGLDNGRTVAEIVGIALAAESSGFDTIWIAEQHFRRGAFSIAAAVAEATSTLGIGFGILSAVIAARLLARDPPRSKVLGVVLLSFSVAVYQSLLFITVGLLSFHQLTLLLEDSTYRPSQAVRTLA